MTNREKFREELAGAIKESLLARHPGSDVCGFIKDKVWPSFLTKEEITGSRCGNNIFCDDCTKAFVFWLDEEYTEPPKPEVDWKNVPVDTLVRVRNSEDDKWLLRYFHLYCEDAVALKYNRKYKTFDCGATSKTCMYPDESWRYCELVEEEEDE